MDQRKVTAVLEWPLPSGSKQLHCFLGFSNFYPRFIRGYSGVAAQLHRLTSSKLCFVWDESAAKTFSELKRHFSTPPILMQPDPSEQFIVEVDASDWGVGVVLSQRASTNKLYPCSSSLCPTSLAPRPSSPMHSLGSTNVRRTRGRCPPSYLRPLLWELLCGHWSARSRRAAYGYQPPLFPRRELRAASSEPSAFVRCCQRTWRKFPTLLPKRQERICLSANRRRTPAPKYQVGDKAWLSSQDVPVKGTSHF
ncbi:hypothetical protein Q8A73_003874 [Channa argus]|nr:hypothetical protein Q8A73_003874 [Channa argus]